MYIVALVDVEGIKFPRVSINDEENPGACTRLISP